MTAGGLPFLVLSSVAFGLAVGLGVSPVHQAVNRLNRNFFARLRTRYTELGMSAEWLGWHEAARWGLAAAAGVAVAVAGLVPVGALTAVVVFNLYGAWLLWGVERTAARIRDQLVLAARDYGNQVRAGLSLTQGLEATCKGLDRPLAPLLQRVVQQARQDPGFFLTALDQLKKAVKMDGMTVFVTAITVAHGQGGKLAIILDRLGQSLEELQRVERKREGQTAGGRRVVTILISFPFGFLSLFYFLDPEATGLLFSLLGGQIILSAVGLMLYGSYRWARAILGKVE